MHFSASGHDPDLFARRQTEATLFLFKWTQDTWPTDHIGQTNETLSQATENLHARIRAVVACEELKVLETHGRRGRDLEHKRSTPAELRHLLTRWLQNLTMLIMLQKLLRFVGAQQRQEVHYQALQKLQTALHIRGVFQEIQEELVASNFSHACFGFLRDSRKRM